MLRRILGQVETLVKGVLGLRLIDPIEVFYLPEHVLIYPIVSKSGNSSVKLKIIQSFNPGFTAEFPKIHHAAPEALTRGRVKRLFFSRVADYHSFCAGKNIRLIIRNPYDRFYSFYQGVITGKNVLYRDPSRLQWLFRFSVNISWERLLTVACLTPDYLADRHFRTQSFFAGKRVQQVAASVEVLELSSFISFGAVLSGSVKKERTAAEIKLNSSHTSLSSAKRKQLQENRRFRTKYGEDLKLYHEAIGGVLS